MIVAETIQPTPVAGRIIDVRHVIPYMHPAAGGPPVVVDRLCRVLPDHGYRCHVASTDMFARTVDRAWLQQFQGSYPVTICKSRGPGTYSYSRELFAQLDGLVAKSHLVHLHTVWTYPTWAAMRVCRRHRVPYIVMPHGMLDPHSLERKWTKKQLYGRLIEWPNLRRANGMVYTHQAEQELAEASVSGLPTGFIVPLGTDDPPQASREILADEFLSANPVLRDKDLIVFLSRLHSKKGLDLLIPAFARVAARHPRAHLVLVGPGDPSYIASLQHLAAQQGVAARCNFTGPLEGRAKWTALAAATVFALPSYQENFALVVVEAQRMGVPVLISRRVNIWQDIVTAGGGVVAELSIGGVTDSLESLFADRSSASIMGRRGQQFVSAHYRWDLSAQALSRVYQQVLGI